MRPITPSYQIGAGHPNTEAKDENATGGNAVAYAEQPDMVPLFRLSDTPSGSRQHVGPT
ncbi:hypothetical protein SAMD00023353_3200430 [Rosellinia necatrix]|uniref:Uncharacterized protein n=1 Tax=Rosellinia necatrix TaxID=77044 RepID=A0A1S8A8R2_ROSNE|nr:hypothetical protein SAMD00023353_3200430 [Rosellinia necatrix]